MNTEILVQHSKLILRVTITKLKKSGEYHHDEETSSHRQLASKVLLFFNLKQKQKKTRYIEIDKSEKNGR